MKTQLISLKSIFSTDQLDLNCELCDYAIREEINVNENNNKQIEGLIESATAYLRAKNLALDKYHKLYSLTIPFLKKEITTLDKQILNDYLRSFLLQSKISIDLLVCLVKALETRKIPTNVYPDIKNPKTGINDIDLIFKTIRKTGWFKELKKVRDQLIHKGFDSICTPVYRTREPSYLDIYLAKPAVQVIKTPMIKKELTGLPYDMHAITFRLDKREEFDLKKILLGFCLNIPIIEKELAAAIKKHVNLKIFENAPRLEYKFTELTHLRLTEL
jgi:hypothetical protein